MSKLSNVQQRRLGGILTVSRYRLPIDDVTQELIDGDFAEWRAGNLELTKRGEMERERLLTLAGLNLEKKQG